MNYRINTRVIVIVGLLVIVAIGLFAYTLVTAPTEELEVMPPQKEGREVDEERLITARHQYVDGLHTIAGTATVPTACHRLFAEPFLLEEGTVAEVRFTTLLEGEECPPSPLDVPFLVTFEADENVTVRATWNGASVRLNLVPVGPGESIDTEIYYKG